MAIFRCIRKCFYADKVWERGEVMEASIKTHEHFVLVPSETDTPVTYKVPSGKDESGAKSLLTPLTNEEKIAAVEAKREAHARVQAGEAVAPSELAASGPVEVNATDIDSGLLD